MGNWKDVKCAVKTGSGCGSPCRNDMQYIFGPFPRDVCVLYLNFCSIFQIAKCCNQRRMWNRHLQGFEIQGKGVMKLVIIRVTAMCDTDALFRASYRIICADIVLL